MKIKFWDTKNTQAGFKIFFASLITMFVFILGFWAVNWLIRVQTMFFVGLLLGVALFFFYYHTLGYVWRRWFK